MTTHKGVAAAEGAGDIYNDGQYRVPRSKRTNVLLVRPQVGKVKPTTYDLPSEGYVYGRKDIGDEEGAREVVGSWKNHTPNPDAEPGRDFMRLNKGAVVHGCTTSKNISSYREEHDIRLQTGPVPRYGSGTDPSYPNATTAFGRPSKPSTPINSLLCNSYQRNWIASQRQTAKAEEEVSAKKQKKQPAAHTRASLGHVKVKKDAPKKPFKLKQFVNVESRVKMPKIGKTNGSAPSSESFADSHANANANAKAPEGASAGYVPAYVPAAYPTAAPVPVAAYPSAPHALPQPHRQ